MIGAMRLILGFCLSIIFSSFHSPGWTANSASQGVITLGDGRGVMAAPMNVYFYRPQSFQTNGRILIAIHGKSRNADRYRDYFMDAAERYGVLVLAPEFSRQNFRGSRQFNLGNLKNRAGHFSSHTVRSFLVIDRVFDQSRDKLRFKQKKYSLFGHSAGSQFVHRLILFSPSQKLTTAVAANAGWYTEPDIKIDFPYGMGNTLETDSLFRRSFAQKLIIMLGQDDDDENHHGLRITMEARAQGAHRLARGRYFFNRAKEIAQKSNFKFSWQIKEIPDVGHSGRLMAEAASNILFGSD